MGRKLAILFAALCVGILLTESVRLWWFDSSDPVWKNDPMLAIVFPPEGTAGVERMVLKDTRGGKELAFDYGDLVRLFDPDKERWSMDVFYLEYDAGNKRQLKDMFDHSPEVCLRASGSTLERTLPTLEGEVDGVTVSARHLVFGHPINNQSYHVFKLVWLARMDELGIEGEETDFRTVRLKAALNRHSHPPARMILASVNGAAGDEEARSLFVSEILERCRLAQSK